MTDPFREAAEYLKSVPTGRATVAVKDAKEFREFKNRNRPLHVLVEEWAEHHDFTFATDRADPVAATLYYFRVKR